MACAGANNGEASDEDDSSAAATSESSSSASDDESHSEQDSEDTGSDLSGSDDSQSEDVSDSQQNSNQESDEQSDESSSEGESSSESNESETSSDDEEDSSSVDDSSDTSSDDDTTTGYDRLVAIGDIHGDLNALHQVLEVAELVDGSGKWTAKNTLVVQTGDLIDRGSDDRAVLEEVESRIIEAQAAGSRLVVLNGNHEIINSESDFRYVTDDAWAQFDDIEPQGPFADKVKNAPAEQRGRMAAFLPGGVFALRLADRPIAVVLEESIFVHGGLTPGYAQTGIDAINQDSESWLRGELSTIPKFAHGDDCPIWTRYFSDPDTGVDCEMLEQTLKIVGAKRMIVGHTVHTQGITSYCDDQVWVIDVGMSAYYGGKIEALEIIDGEIHVLE
jgi:hypothetical protein